MSSKIQTFISKLIFKYLKILIMMFKKKQANKAFLVYASRSRGLNNRYFCQQYLTFDHNLTN